MGRLGIALVVLLCACGDNAKLAGDAGIDGSQFLCGNGVVDGTEQCDAGDANGSRGGLSGVAMAAIMGTTSRSWIICSPVISARAKSPAGSSAD